MLTRRPTLHDAEGIHRLVSACNIRDVGRPDATLEDIADELGEPAFDLGRDGWVVEHEDGTIVGWAWAYRNGVSNRIDIDVYALDAGVAQPLWDAVEQRAAEIARESGHDSAVIDLGAYRSAEQQAREARLRGYTVGTTYHRMRIDYDGPRPRPEPPPGVVVLDGPLDEEHRRGAHEVWQASFVDHDGFAPKTYDAWVEERDAYQTNDWAQLRLATVDGQPAAMLLGSNQFVVDENAGYVVLVGTLPAHRGRGLARHLLEVAFAHDAAAGRSASYLHVDSNNRTPALGLYTSAGMRPVLVIDVWRKTVPT